MEYEYHIELIGHATIEAESAEEALALGEGMSFYALEIDCLGGDKAIYAINYGQLVPLIGNAAEALEERDDKATHKHARKAAAYVKNRSIRCDARLGDEVNWEEYDDAI